MLAAAIALVLVPCGSIAGAATAPRGMGARAAAGHGTVPLGQEASLRHVRVVRRARAAALGGQLHVACPLSGEVVGTITVQLPSADAPDWSATVSARTGADGCAFTDELKLPAGITVAVQLRSQDGKVVAAVDAKATIATTLIPTKSAFDTELRLVVGQGVFDASATGSTDGATFAGDIARDGTFVFSFDIDDVDVFGTKTPVHGRVARAAPGAEPTVALSGATPDRLPLMDNVELRDAQLSWRDRHMVMNGTTRIYCTTGYVDLATGGGFNPDGSLTLSVDGTASNCTFGNQMTLDGHNLHGSITFAKHALKVDLDVSIASLDLGTHDSGDYFGLVSISLHDIAAQITNSCDGCTPDHLRIAFTAGAHIVTHQPGFDLPLDLEATAHGAFDLIGWKTLKISLVVDDAKYGDIPIGLVIAIEGQLVRSIEGAFVVDSSAPPPTVTVQPAAEEPVSAQSSATTATRGPVQSVTVVLGSCNALVRCLPKARVEVRLRTRGQVSLSLQRQRCSGVTHCRWSVVRRGVYAPDSRGRTVRVAVSKRLASGRYRVVARSVGAARATQVERTFVAP